MPVREPPLKQERKKMSENSVCPIWGTVASVEPMSGRDGIFVDSPRAGGKYFISRRAEIILKNKEDEIERAGSADDGFNHAMGTPSEVERLKARLTSEMIEQRRLGEDPKITGHTLEEVEKRQHLPVHERADRLLHYIQQATAAIGEQVKFQIESGLIMYPSMASLENINNGSLNHYRMMAWSECTKSNYFDEVAFLLEYLQERGWIEYNSNLELCVLTVEGYAHLAELENVATVSSQAFVAMWFDESMDNVYQNGIRPGIEDAGYNPLPINKKEHINKIDDEIIAEIRRSRFVVADFTHGESGARGGVYYEAGYAHGLHKDVIFTCRADLVEKVHFDTRQYNHITWEPEKLDEFSKALSDRISAVIGDGPKKTRDTE